MRETHTNGHRGHGHNGRGEEWESKTTKVRIPGRRSKAHVCPYCGESDEVIPVFYGYPSDETFRMAERGEVYLGGCAIGGYNPRFYCKRDSTEF